MQHLIPIGELLDFLVFTVLPMDDLRGFLSRPGVNISLHYTR
jgi:hypothetical protein